MVNITSLPPVLFQLTPSVIAWADRNEVDWNDATTGKVVYFWMITRMILAFSMILSEVGVTAVANLVVAMFGIRVRVVYPPLIGQFENNKKSKALIPVCYIGGHFIDLINNSDVLKLEYIRFFFLTVFLIPTLIPIPYHNVLNFSYDQGQRNQTAYWTFFVLPYMYYLTLTVLESVCSVVIFGISVFLVPFASSWIQV